MPTTQTLQTAISIGRSRFKSMGEQIGWFVMHLGVVYMTAKYCVWWLGNILDFHAQSVGGRMQFVLSHLFLLCVLLGVVGGLAGSRLRQKAALYVWIVPAIFLAARLAVFFPGPLFEHQIGPAIRYYFGGHFQLSAFNTYRDLAKGGLGREVLRGADQLAATAPFYVSAAYSLSAWLGVRAGLYVPGGPNKELTHMTPQLPVRP